MSLDLGVIEQSTLDLPGTARWQLADAYRKWESAWLNDNIPGCMAACGPHQATYRARATRECDRQKFRDWIGQECAYSGRVLHEAFLTARHIVYCANKPMTLECTLSNGAVLMLLFERTRSRRLTVVSGGAA